MIISHRGNDLHKFKENTKEAIISTLSNDYTSGVELDVRMTKDKKIVLSHSLFYKEHIINNNNIPKLRHIIILYSFHILIILSINILL